MKLTFLTCESFIHGSNDDQADDTLLTEALQKLGHQVETIPWSVSHHWKSSDAVIIRTTWDYMLTPEKFLHTLEKISKQTSLFNSYQTVKWNIHKSYLLDLEKKGIKIVPTLLFKDKITLPPDWKYDKYVIKPAISASAYKTLMVSQNEIETGKYKKSLITGDWLCQPFLPQISEGEISLIYFNKKFSHALLKVPRKGDFRVQIEWGGTIQPYTPSEKLLTIGEDIMNAVTDDLLYARVDLVPEGDDYMLMELELIEPALYFRTNPDSPKNFCKALIDVQKTK